MPLVFAGVCSHAPGITGRAHLADAAIKDVDKICADKEKEIMEV